MLASKTRWKVGAPDPDKVRVLQQRLNIRPLLAALLAARGIGPEEAEFFLSSDLEFHDPLLLDGMDTAADRIERAIRGGEYIRIYGDYDADGVSSTSLMVRLMRILGARFDYYIPHRVTEGYGLNIQSVEQAHADGVDLLVTVDTGISAVEQVSRAAELGLDVIVTDHHEPPELLPDALAVINPKKPGCPYPFKGLAGVGVAFKLAQALLKRVPEELAEFAALGTIADLMPLTGENRAIVKLGLERLKATPYEGFVALLRVAGISQKDVSAGQVAFALAPRINAVGRLESADEAVRLLVTDDAEEAAHYARRLDALNRERQEIVEVTAKAALEQAEQPGDIPDAIVVFSDRWNPGVIGIVASKIVERYHRPAIVIAVDPETGIGKGSARAIPGFHLYEALQQCADILEHFGGHESAAGLSVRVERIGELTYRLNEYASRMLTPEMKLPSLSVDAEVTASDVTAESIIELDMLAPYGMGHPTPRFVIRGALSSGVTTMGKDGKHVKIELQGDHPGTGIEAVYFGMGEIAPFISSGARVDLLGELSVNEWKGRKKPQLIVRDMCIPHKQVFDWRDVANTKAADDCWRQWRMEERQAAILTTEREGIRSAFESRSISVPVYMLCYDGNWRHVNEHTAPQEIKSVTDVIMACHPFPLHSFRHILEQCTSLERIYAAFGDSDFTKEYDVDRKALGAVYSAIKEQTHGSEQSLITYVKERTGLKPALIRFAIQVFRELELLEAGEDGNTIRCPEAPQKRELQESPTYRMELEAAKARRLWAGCPSEALYRRLFEAFELEEDFGAERKTEAIL